MNISTLEAFVEQQNRWRDVFNERPLSLLNPKDRQAIANIIDSKLSPENLTCDGELSGREVQLRQRQLFRVAEELISVDPSVTFYELSV